jgi:hypothetical protein
MMDAWNTMKRARDLLTMAYCFADKGVEEDSCRDLAMMLVAAEKRRESKPNQPMSAMPHRRDP